MIKTVQLVHEYPVTADRLWQVATDWASFVEATKGLISFRGLPDEPIHKGQIIKSEVSIFGLLPYFSWTMEIRECDPERHLMKSHEYGGSVKLWDHTIKIDKTETGSGLTDTIILDAGYQTPIYAWWARLNYGRRHKPRLKLLGLA
ncbi:MAG: hypothetical protein KTR19_07500 [Hyphomicrobiales bacterium]|nr:hypothetical protein [Hyphomicrobiales bacterium]